jgi:hypothetical protein
MKLILTIIILNQVILEEFTFKHISGGTETIYIEEVVGKDGLTKIYVLQTIVEGEITKLKDLAY